MRKDPDVQTLSEIFFRIEEIRCPYYLAFCTFIESLAAVISHNCGNLTHVFLCSLVIANHAILRKF